MPAREKVKNFIEVLSHRLKIYFGDYTLKEGSNHGDIVLPVGREAGKLEDYEGIDFAFAESLMDFSCFCDGVKYFWKAIARLS